VLIVTRGGSGPSARDEVPGTGEVWRDRELASSDGVSIGNVFFSPSSRTHWHTHEGGQILIGVAGEGFVADADGPVRVTAGDIIWTPPGVRHWHGAAAGRYLLHTGISLGGTEFLEPVSDDEYPAPA
jgi:quercetin dioxygenase-like cupin family protein